MTERFGQWYSQNQDAISWFLIGVLFASGVNSLILGDYFWAAWNLGFAVINYKLIPHRV